MLTDILILPDSFRGRNSLAGIAKGYGLDGRGSILDRGIYFHVLHSIHTGSGPHPASYLIGAWHYFAGVKWPERETDQHLHLVPRSRMVELYLHSPAYVNSLVLN
jgi:hypothetical protein